VFLHFTLSRKCKKRSIFSVLQQLQAGASLPTATTQTVINRSAAACLDCDLDAPCFGFVQVGIAANLFGNDDKDLTGDMKSVF
jgi:hypothetical protein